MLELLRFFAALALLKRRPQDLPDSLFLLQVLLALDIVLSLLLGMGHFADSVDALLITLVELLVSAALLFAGLHSVGKSARWRQAYIALLGIGVLGSLISVLYRVLAGLLGLPELVGLLDLVVFFWLMFAMAHIVRHAFEIPLPFAMLIVFAYTLFVVGLVAQWFVPEMAVPQS